MTVSLRFETEQFKNFARNMRETLWGDLHLATQRWWKEILEAHSEARMERCLGLKWYERAEEGSLGSSTRITKNGANASSSFLHKLLEVTQKDRPVDSDFGRMVDSRAFLTV